MASSDKKRTDINFYEEIVASIQSSSPPDDSWNNDTWDVIKETCIKIVAYEKDSYTDQIKEESDATKPYADAYKKIIQNAIKSKEMKT